MFICIVKKDPSGKVLSIKDYGRRLGSAERCYFKAKGKQQDSYSTDGTQRLRTFTQRLTKNTVTFVVDFTPS